MAYYNSVLLDELHRLFPAVLYDQSRFRDNDLVQYIRERVRNVYNLYDSAQRTYMHNNEGQPRVHRRRRGRRAGPMQAPVPAPAPVQAPTVRTYLNSATQDNDTLTAILGLLNYPPSPATPAPVSSPTSSFLRYPGTGYNFLPTIPSIPGFTAEATYLGSANLDGTRTGRGESWAEILASFMNPVPIRPSQAQIEAGSRLYTTDASTVRESCVICFEPITEGQDQRELRTCGHAFHCECIDRHFQTSPRCPLCRHDVRDATPTSNFQ
jgi:hypothetical protein